MQVKQEIHEYVDRADEQLLKLIYVMMKGYGKNGESLGFDSVGGVITKDQLIDRAVASNKAISEGRLKNVDEIRKELKNWK